MSLQPISIEQQKIIDLVSGGYNVSIDAVAGSGKTTTSLYIGINNPNKSILLLTYNAKLKLETRQKIEQLNLKNMEIHSYHSFCVKYFNNKAYTDSGIISFLKKNDIKTQNRAFCYDIVIIDESQDMTPLYYEVVQHILIRHKIQPQIIVMGDQKQSIYAFNKADSRFLRLCQQIYPPSHEWKSAQLNTSYRLTNQMTQFINQCCNGSLPMKSIKSGPAVRYVICDTFGYQPIREIDRILKQGIKCDDIFILSPSVRSPNSPVRKLANYLTRKNIPIYVPTTDEEKLDSDVLTGKIVFSSFHQAKGLERSVVLVYNIDHSYFTFYATDIPRQDYNQIPNTVYVALTRAKSQLIIFHDHKQKYMDCINRYLLSQYAQLDVHESLNLKFNDDKPMKTTKISVTDLVKFVPVEVIEQCISYLTIKTINPKEIPLDLPIKTKQNELYENVSEITGTSIPSYFEYATSGKMTIYDYLSQHKMDEIMDFINDQPNKPNRCLLGDDDECDDRYKQWYKDIIGDHNTCENLLKLSTEWICESSGYQFKKKQIKNYDWLNPEILQLSINRLDKLFPTDTHNNLQFEKSLVERYGRYCIVGFADIYNTKSNQLYELKVVNEINHSHMLQVAIYCWLINRLETTLVSSMYLFNIMNNELIQIESTQEKLTHMVDLLIDAKNHTQEQQSDKQFIDKCHIINDKFKSN